MENRDKENNQIAVSRGFCSGFWKIFDIFAVPEGARWPDAICQGRGNTRHLLGTGSAGVRLLHMQKVSGEMRGTKGSQSRSGANMYFHPSICNNHQLQLSRDLENSLRVGICGP